MHTNEIQRVLWFAENDEFKTWEFETFSTHEIEENEVDLFRFFFHKLTDNTEVMVANREDYYIHEDASYLFNLPELQEFLERLEVEDASEQFNKWYYEEQEE